MEKTLQSIIAELVDYIIKNEQETKTTTIRISSFQGVVEAEVIQEKRYVKGVNQELKAGWINGFGEGLTRQEWSGQEYADYLKPINYDVRAKAIPCNVELDGKTICKSKKL